tara:strand:- start:171 stop:485 length:315 start_codon:yes stop_codon:yes gene_type:complete
MKKIIPLMFVLLLASCGGMNPLSLLSGGGPNVAANVQAGKENNQAVSQIDTTTTTAIESGSVTIMNQSMPIWAVLLLILGWVLPSPAEIWRGFVKTITLGRYKG